MRILMISDVFFPRINGVSTSIQTFQRELTELGHEITLIAPEYGPDDDQYYWLHRIPSRFILVDPEDRMMKRRCIDRLTENFSKDDFDIVHIQTPFVAHYAGVALSRRLNLPRIETYHTHFEEYLYHYFPYLPRSLMRYSARWFNNKQCNDVDGVIVPSKAMFDVLKEYGVKVPIEIVATGIDEEMYQPGDGVLFRREYNIPGGQPVLLHIGRVAHEKNIDFLLHSLVLIKRQIPDILLVIAGEGPAENHLHSLVQSLGITDNIKFIGYLDRKTSLLDCYAAANLFVFASKTETQGLVLLEAMAQGLPVVSIAALGTNDILDANQGALIAKEDYSDFRDRVITLLDDKDKYQSLQAETIPYARSWSANAFAMKTSDFYQQVAENYRLN